ncbi:centrosome-associated protein 350 isoform X2 [Amia ocellicauda]|uniref:centrosome-associated protein 350 isoform X2 n=1 Tax=Amia ocellicauda TaxID=2972642 RepID=UPI003464377B
MWSGQRSELPLTAPGQPAWQDTDRELSTAWGSLFQTKSALRHIENRLEATPSSTALLESVMDTKKTSSVATRKISRKDGRYAEDHSLSSARGVGRTRTRKEKSSRSPLRATTLESNVRRSCVEFREPLASYRERTPPLPASAPPEAESVPLSAQGRAEHMSRLLYQRDTRDLQSQELDSSLTSQMDSTVVHYLNDLPALEALHSSEMPCRSTEQHRDRETRDRLPGAGGVSSVQERVPVAEVSQSSSPGSASQRLENLRRRQPDDKLEKLKERIRRQREHSEEVDKRDRTVGCLEHPLGGAGAETAAPTAKVRKVATAPPPPAYKGFNPTETRIRTPDGKVWCEEEFHNLSREVYRDLSLQLTESGRVKEKPADKGKDKKATSRPVRKVHRAERSPSPDAKPGAHVISTASWREGQKLVKMVLGPVPKPARDPMIESSDRADRTGPPTRTTSDPRLASGRKPRANSGERPRSRAHSEGQLKSSRPMAKEDEAGLAKDLLSADIRCILDDLQMESQGAGGQAEKTQRRVDGGGGGGAGGSSSRLSRSASPAKRKQESSKVGPKKRHYDADSVRQYIARQQEERRKRQTEEKRAQREEAERKNRRLQELYRKQKAKLAPGGPVQKRLQETYSKLLLEQARLEETSQPLPVISNLQTKPLYQPSGESDKENKGQERPLSASSSSNLSLSEPQAPPLGRSDLAGTSWMQPDRLSPAGRGPLSPVAPSGSLFTQLLGLESGLSALQKEGQTRGQPPPSSAPTYPSKGAGQYKSKMNRIEALKATAASLSTRIESEARKLAGAGVNYGSLRDLDSDVLPVPPQDNGHWAKPVSPPVREIREADDLSARIERLLNANHDTFEGGLPGVGNVHDFRKPREPTRPHTSLALGSRAQAGERQHECHPRSSLDAAEVDGESAPQDSSAGSISEGPLLSEGSFSDVEEAPHPKELPKPAERLRNRDFCMAEQNTFRPIAHFQKEAEKYPAFSTTSEAVDTRGPWEELAKGSPHSVINIFTKNLHSYGKVLEDKPDRSSPALRPLLPAASPVDVASYEDDFISSRSSTGHSSKRSQLGLSNGHSASSPHEELPSRRSPYDARLPDHLSHHSSTSTPASSPRSSGSVRRKGGEVSGDGARQHPLLEGDRTPSSQDSELGSQESKRASPGNASSRISEPGPDSPRGDASARSPPSSGSEGLKSPRHPASSPSGSPTNSAAQKSPASDGSSAGTDRARTGAPHATAVPSPNARLRPMTVSSAFTEFSVGGSGEPSVTGPLQFSPGVLEQRMAAELSYLDAMEESVRQLSDVERVRGVSLAQQESVSLAQILKAQQQRHERDLYLLKLKAEQEALDSQRQLDETRQRAAQAHAESQQSLAHSQQEALGTMQDATSKMISQQAEAVRYSADAARHIKEMTELARSQIAGALSVPAAPLTALFDQQRQQHSSFMKQLRSRTDTDSRKSEGSPLRTRTEEGHSSFDSYSESSHCNTQTPSSASSQQDRPSTGSLDRKEGSSLVKERRGSSELEEEVQMAADDSIRSDSAPSLPEEKDTTSIATEYSLKFDESMTEDEIEEKSFRSLLPSESHRRFTLEKRRGPHEDSDDEPSQEKAVLYATKDGRMPFSSGQDSFSKFTMEMVRQYMKEEEVRAQHQSSLLRLREKALKEKTKAELAWLEHQKRRLRDKGEDDKMPPLRKRQRGLLLKLQQEQAEIKRLQEANKAARKERQLLLKQQEEIERMRHTTMKLQERLKSAGDTQLDAPHSDTVEEEVKPSPAQTDLETRSPSPLSVSGSETSSIMQKLKKMRSHMDEKHCSPVHYFFSVFTSHHWASLSVCFPNLHPKFQLFIYNQLVRFLTKREQQLMQRRRHAEELLEWKRRLDEEEAEVRRMERQALAAWDTEMNRDRPPRREPGPASLDSAEPVSEEQETPGVTHSSSHSDLSIPEEVGSPAKETPVSELPSPGKDATPLDNTTYSQDFDTPSSYSKTSPSSKASLSISKQDATKGGSASSKMQLKPSPKPGTLSGHWSDESLSVTQSETASDQSDIESRIRALKDELRRRKSIVYQLKKEQKKRHKERLKAQEASLLKQLESYDDFIKKTTAELDEETDTSPSTKPQIKTLSSVAEKPRIKPPPLQRTETHKNWKLASESERSQVLPDHDVLTPATHSRSKPANESRTSEEESTVSSPTRTSPELATAPESPASPQPVLGNLSEGRTTQEGLADRFEDVSGDERAITSQRSEIVEELDLKSEESEAEDLHSQSEDLRSEHLLRLDPGLLSETQELSSQKNVLSPDHVGPVAEDQSDLGEEADIADGKRKDYTEDEVGEDQSSKSSVSLKSQQLEKPLVSVYKEHPVVERQSSETSLPTRDVSYSPDFDVLSPDKQTSAKEKKESPRAESYLDDFESSLDSTPRKDMSFHESKMATSNTPEREEDKSPRSKSPSMSSEEEIDEELSVKSLSVSGSFHSERLLEIKSPTEDSARKERNNGKQNWSPALSPPTTPPLLDLDLMSDFNVGDRVVVSNVQPGTLRFKGKTSFANGFWAGVELDKSEGSNNGTYDGVVYFECEEGHGIFAPPDKISHLPEKFEVYVDTTEDEDSFFDDQCDEETKGKDEQKDEEPKPSGREEKQEQDEPESQPKGKALGREASSAHPALQTPIEEMDSHGTIGQMVKAVEFSDLEFNLSEKSIEDKHLILNGRNNIVLDLKNSEEYDLLISEVGRVTNGHSTKQVEETSPTPLLDLLAREKDHLEAQIKPPVSEVTLEKGVEEKRDEKEEHASAFTEKLLNNFIKDAVDQFQQIKKVRNEKIIAANQNKDNEQEEETSPRVLPGKCLPPDALRDSLPSLLEEEREEASSPELCPRPESPVFGASGQEELAKRLAELELSRELLDVLGGDEQDWFDEDFGLSSRKEQQKQQQQQQGQGAGGALVAGAVGVDQAKLLPRPEPPPSVKPREEPLMVVPHTAPELERLVHAATAELWKSQELGHSIPPTSAPAHFLGNDSKGQDIDSLSKRSYRQAVFDLTAEIFQEIFAEDPNFNQPQWKKTLRVSSSYFRRVKNPSDLSEVETFIAAEVLKLFGLKKDHNQKTDWQKMLKFGRKKRDRVDHILVQELHEEESQWVNYDEDELYVKMQLADGIFDALLKDTVDVLNQIQDKKAKRALS